ncbi:Nucleotide-binding protein implicated in inhibition of septum formation [Nitrospirillum viridazoti Y2]|uniref:Nucleoside triphosphate pyrophosphatase n=1 Tax=Nitrospirillum amazonense TaxID=28077 RepID=A0A560HQ68_9PROT|nr:nucleoside triphosphate pyrophosphatase [Nitrospirillum amazonense]EGY02607.1 Nucleotide-binding protein implicated in inhibition of septum formation [Nitrospirillum amazonense Y2]TWB47210.1 septum formation protein [Nitrospirillum amazonense]
MSSEDFPAAVPIAVLATQPVVLASGSQTRLSLLRGAGLEVVAHRPGVDEEEVKLSCKAGGLTVEETAEALAELKASRVAAKVPAAYVIGADQMLECEGRWFDKPEDRAGAAEQLRALSGRTHRLVTTAVLFHNNSRVWHQTDQAKLTMRTLSDDFIERYLDAAGDAVLTSVGGYQLEALGAQLFTRVAGDHFTILGLPLLPLLGFLRVRGVLPS